MINKDSFGRLKDITKIKDITLYSGFIALQLMDLLFGAYSLQYIFSHSGFAGSPGSVYIVWIGAAVISLSTSAIQIVLYEYVISSMSHAMSWETFFRNINLLSVFLVGSLSIIDTMIDASVTNLLVLNISPVIFPAPVPADMKIMYWAIFSTICILTGGNELITSMILVIAKQSKQPETAFRTRPLRQPQEITPSFRHIM